jgi:uncharacterized protein HemX
MSKDRLEVSDQTAISMPIRNMLAIVGAVAIGTWAYFGIQSRITSLETHQQLAEKDLSQAVKMINNELEKNTEFRIKWPRGDLGSPPADSEQFMLIEFLSGQVEALQGQLKGMMNNQVNIERLQTDMEKSLRDIEKLKDKIRSVKNGHVTGE